MHEMLLQSCKNKISVAKKIRVANEINESLTFSSSNKPHLQDTSYYIFLVKLHWGSFKFEVCNRSVL